MLNIRFNGTDTALMISPSAEDEGEDGEKADKENFVSSFKKIYKEELGLLRAGNGVVADDIEVRWLSYRSPSHNSNKSDFFFQVRGTGKPYDTLGPSVYAELKTSEARLVEDGKVDSRYSVYFDGIGWCIYRIAWSAR